MKKHVSWLDLERANSHVVGFVEGLNVTKEITLQNVIFDMIESIGSIDQ